MSASSSNPAIIDGRRLERDCYERSYLVRMDVPLSAMEMVAALYHDRKILEIAGSLDADEDVWASIAMAVVQDGTTGIWSQAEEISQKETSGELEAPDWLAYCRHRVTEVTARYKPLPENEPGNGNGTDEMHALHEDSGNAHAESEAAAHMRLLARKLAERGFQVRSPDSDGSYVLTITNARNARCEINAADEYVTVWEYVPDNRSGTSPAEISRIVLCLLGSGQARLARLHAHLPRGATLKGAVARAMQAYELKADLEVYEDQIFFDVVAEVVITNPAKPGRGLVRVTDDGAIRWECGHGDMTGRASVIAEATAQVLVRCARPDGAGR